jgi:hypothetical protein
VGNEAVKMFRKHSVPQSAWQEVVCENANITDEDDAKYIARKADIFVFRFGADECSGNARNMDRLKKWPRNNFEIFTQ